MIFRILDCNFAGLGCTAQVSAGGVSMNFAAGSTGVCGRSKLPLRFHNTCSMHTQIKLNIVFVVVSRFYQLVKGVSGSREEAIGRSEAV